MKIETSLDKVLNFVLEDLKRRNFVIEQVDNVIFVSVKMKEPEEVVLITKILKTENGIFCKTIRKDFEYRFMMLLDNLMRVYTEKVLGKTHAVVYVENANYQPRNFPSDISNN